MTLHASGIKQMPNHIGEQFMASFGSQTGAIVTV